MDGVALKIKGAARGISKSFAEGGLGLFFWILVVSNLPAPRLLAEKVQEPPQTVAVITCYEMIDDGLYRSIIRRSNEAVSRGADFIVFDIQTYGGLVKSADDISKYLIHELGKKVHTIAYVSTEAISAGSMISVSCRDIVMRENTTIGCSAPIILSDSEMGKAEREKQESFVRAAFSRAAQANGYPEALLKAMVSQNLEIWQVENLKTRRAEYFESSYLPSDPNAYDLAHKKLVVREGELLTLTDQKALEYGIARAVVEDFEGVLLFLSNQYKVPLSDDIIRLETTWSEEMVRWLNSPVVSGILVMGILLGIYVELHTPGLGLPGLLALVCLIILVGSRYLSGLANWIEVAVLAIGIILVLVEIFVIPGFGITGVTGILCILVGLFALMIQNAPDEIPWPRSEQAWRTFSQSVLGFFGGIAGFSSVAWILARFMPKIAFLSGLTLKPSVPVHMQIGLNETAPAKPSVHVGDTGCVETTLRPAGTARFNGTLFDVVCQAEYIEKGQKVQILEISGNRIMVKKIQEKP
jgi:membrane-bound serine protease (ClpP class)